MAIVPDQNAFPNNVVNVVAERFQTLDRDIRVLKRPIRGSDPVQCVSITATVLNPDENSHEFKGPDMNMLGPTLNQYVYGIQAFIQDMDEVRGLATISTLSQMVRRMLLSDMDLRVALASLQSTAGGVTERFQRFGVREQRFLNNEVDGVFLFMSTLDFIVETESH